MKAIKPLIVLVIFCGMGLQLSLRSWDGEAFIAIKNLNQSGGRNPAAVKKVFDLSQFEGNIFSSNSKKRILQDAVLEKQAGRFSVSLGSFVAQLDGGEKVLACQAYDKVSLVFEAEGVAVDGEIPKMEVEGSCNMTEDMQGIGSLWVPVEKIISQAPSEGDMNFTEENVRVRFSHISDSWPTRWVLKSVSLMDTLNQRPVVGVLTKETNTKMAIDWKTL